MGARSLVCILLLLCAGCAHSSAVVPTANEALLKPCQDPDIPAGNSDNDFATLLLNVGQAYVNCRQEKADLATWARGIGK